MTVPTGATPPVLAVIVAHDGARWLPRALEALAAQSYPALDVIAVDNASADGSREMLVEHLGEDSVLVADRDIGFGAAVTMALDSRRAVADELVLTLHDDLALLPDALEVLVDALTSDPDIAAAGPKLRSWEHDGELQSVGWTIDVTGRADNGVDPGELDQGQRDHEREVLYVSTAGMLLRRRVLDEVGGFDRRYHVFRDDLDLCWRMRLAGHDVEVVPRAVGVHVGGASNYLRLGQTRFIGPRYFAERNTLLTLLKNYGVARLIFVVPLFLSVGTAKILGFLLTRRVSDAWETLRAWLWNLWHLRETMRFRREVQRLRVRDDAELAASFGRITPRVRAYAEAMASWVAGGDVDPAPEPAHTDAPPEPPRSVLRRGVDLARRRPTLVAAAVLVVLFSFAVWPLLLPGELRGGQLAPWPDSPTAFLAPYVAGLNEAGAFGTSAPASPSQALLGLLHLAVGGSSYLAPRVLLLAPLAIGWMFALRATQTYSQRRAPRVVAATAYTLSPPVLAALERGDVGGLVVFAALPALVVGATTLMRRSSQPATAWRAVAGTALAAAVAGAFEPLAVLAVAVVGAFMATWAAVFGRDRRWAIAAVARVSVAAFGPIILLLPWSWDVLTSVELSGAAVPSGEPVWRWLLLAPSAASFPGLTAGAGFFIAGVLGFVFGVRRSPGLVTALWAAALGGAVGAWWLDRVGSPVWPGLALLVTAAAFAGLFATVFAQAEAQLSPHAFGWRQLAAIVTVAGVVVSVGAVASSLLTASWDAYAVDDPALPSFVTAAAHEDAFRVLVLNADEGVLEWEVVDGEGPTMASFGVSTPREALEWVGDAVYDLAAGADPNASDRLGLAGIRYVVTSAEGRDPALSSALAEQHGAQPRPVTAGELHLLAGWVPRAIAVTDVAAEEAEATGMFPRDTDLTVLERVEPGLYRADIPSSSAVILVAEANDGAWQAEAGGEVIRTQLHDLVRIAAVDEGPVVVRHVNSTARGLAVTGQVLAVLLTISLALRPPRFARSFGSEEATS